ncbi:helix-turn-helix transcriptional regulator [Congregibacter litoralis]|uniref:Response regulator n=1 Tax=Congregibacter litoralis KT71 TaxID=314285 RepID=A4ABP4_9GAMM|nr:LuxR C-terminal-related transcriptional regulator [Congregibacter litoralis]EAQ96557.2 Response regulator [Congregibacter litoralis KT71]
MADSKSDRKKTHNDEPLLDDLRDMVQASGILGVDRKDDPEQLERVREVMALLQPEVRVDLVARITSEDAIKSLRIKRFCEHHNLTSAERQLVESLCAGTTSKEYAREHFISPNTVRTHLQRVRQKVGVTRQAQVISQALSWDS